ncbi:MAG: chromate transporter [Clostridia bacterium]|nr:chromate transporter [Clostridia bacterium]
MIYLTLFFEFFKIGLFTFGGGYAMLPLITDAAVSNGWMTNEQLLDFIAVSESTPGPFAVNIATYIGKTVAGIGGSALATLGVVLPSFIVIVTVAAFFMKFKESRAVQGVMSGLRPTAVGLIFAAAASLSAAQFLGGFSGAAELWERIKAAFTTFDTLFTAALLVGAFIAVRKKIHPIFIVIAAAGLGVGYCYLVR